MEKLEEKEDEEVVEEEDEVVEEVVEEWKEDKADTYPRVSSKARPRGCARGEWVSASTRLTTAGRLPRNDTASTLSRVESAQNNVSPRESTTIPSGKKILFDITVSTCVPLKLALLIDGGFISVQ